MGSLWAESNGNTHLFGLVLGKGLLKIGRKGRRVSVGVELLTRSVVCACLSSPPSRGGVPSLDPPWPFCLAASSGQPPGGVGHVRIADGEDVCCPHEAVNTGPLANQQLAGRRGRVRASVLSLLRKHEAVVKLGNAPPSSSLARKITTFGEQGTGNCWAALSAPAGTRAPLLWLSLAARSGSRGA